MIIVSFNPSIEADLNVICAGRLPDENDCEIIKKADAVILPQGCHETLYRLAVANCANVFPNYEVRFMYPSKIGQAKLFQNLRVPFPKTDVYDCLNSFYQALNSGTKTTFLNNFPFVFKVAWSGEGNGVFLIESKNDFDKALDYAKMSEKSGFNGFLLQEYIPTKAKSLRVVVIGKKFVTYWRKQTDETKFLSNLSQGAVIDMSDEPALQALGKNSVSEFCNKTGINLAGFDLLFSEADNPKIPIFLEINWFFGRKALGGSFKYYDLLKTAVEEWRQF